MQLHDLVTYTGQARTFRETFVNQYFHVLRKLHNPRIVVSVADDDQADHMLEMLRTRFSEDQIHFEKVAQSEMPEVKQLSKWCGLYPPSSSPQAILRQLWHLKRGWDFAMNVLDYELPSGVVVRMRPDLVFSRFEMPQSVSPWDSFTPWWSRWGGVNDRVAVLGAMAAPHYFNTFPSIGPLLDMGCPLHPETLVYHRLREGKVGIHHTLATEFVALRLDGSTTPIDPSVIDIAEYARSK